MLATSSPAPEVLLRRTIYLPILRKEMPREMDMLSTFNFVDPAVVSGDRDETIVPTQALYLLNSPFVREQSRVAAERLLNQEHFDDVARVSWFYRMVLGRPATPVEIERSLVFIARMTEKIEMLPSHTGSARKEAWSRMCQSLFACNEFIFRD